MAITGRPMAATNTFGSRWRGPLIVVRRPALASSRGAAFTVATVADHAGERQAAAASANLSAGAVEVALARTKALTLGLSAALTVALYFDCAAALASPNVELGKQVFNGNCAACHAGGRNVVIAEKTLDKAALEQYLDGGFNVDAIVYQVENGKGAMPAWEDRLSAEEIQGVAAYVYQTALNNAWGSQ